MERGVGGVQFARSCVRFQLGAILGDYLRISPVSVIRLVLAIIAMQYRKLRVRAIVMHWDKE